jgi:hypothetical protein
MNWQTDVDTSSLCVAGLHTAVTNGVRRNGDTGVSTFELSKAYMDSESTRKDSALLRLNGRAFYLL